LKLIMISGARTGRVQWSNGQLLAHLQLNRVAQDCISLCMYTHRYKATGDKIL
jgi:hypothetical protein